MDMFGEDEPTTEYAYAAFKATRICVGQSIENPPNGNLVFVVSHHFGAVNEGFYEFFGLDQATTRIGFEYGVNDWLAIGIGRSTLEKTFDGFVKTKILRQSSGARNMPFSVSYFGSAAISTLKWQYPDRENYCSSRWSFANQILIARKFSNAFTFQIMPTLIHRNLVETSADQNDVWSIGAGGRVKVSNRVSINAEYYYLLPGQTADDFYNTFTIGVDLETGGHVFQLFATNGRGAIEEYYIPQTTGTWLEGDIRIGFNITRAFTIKQPKSYR
jgi:opacity protein-like surface antigen